LNESVPRRRFYDSIPAQALIALSFNVMSLFAGGLISIFTPRFEAAPWILALFPPILTIRGGIGGVFSGNLATMLHLGLIHPRVRGNTPLYGQLVSSVFVITLIDTLAMGGISFALSMALGRASLGQAFIFLTVPPVACFLAMAVSIPLTSLIAIATFRKGLDPDILVYPILASLNDIVVTACFVVTSLMVLLGGAWLSLLAALFALVVSLSGLLAYRNRRIDFFYQTIREGTTVVIVSSIFGNLNGAFLSGLSRDFVRYPGLLVLYPALTNALGNIGSIVGSTMTTNLALGYLRSLREEVRGALSTVLQVEAMALLMHLVFGIVSYAIASQTASGASLTLLVGLALISNLCSFALISLFAIVVAFLAFRRGLNPDNIVIPLITSFSDTVATLTILPALGLLVLLLAL
jgi:mgtE-like transporter